MKFLIIDTSSAKSFVALYTGEKLFTELLPPLKQSQTLLPAVQKLLQNQAIDFIAVGTGPGSFTGTRVGVMTAKALGLAKDLPLLPFCSLKAYTPKEGDSFTIYGDAKSGKAFALEGERNGGEVIFRAPYLTEAQKTYSEDLNLPFLGNYLLKQFHQSGGVSHSAVTVSYLKNP